MTEQIKVYIQRLDPKVSLPEYANLFDSGMDVRASQDISIDPQQTVVIPTGLKFAIPEGFEIQVRARSGLSLNTPLRVSNGIGTIDSSYRGELGIIMTNTSERSDDFYHYSTSSKGNLDGAYEIQKGDRIAQIVLQRVPRIEWVEVESVKEIGSDRNGGFGSSGVK
jgi:dUTP pyrophosphatase